MMGGLGGLSPQAKNKSTERQLCFTELLVGRSFFARFLRQKWRLALYKFVINTLLYYRSASKHDIDIVSGVIIEYFTSVNRIFYEFNRIFYEFLLE